MKKVLGLTFIFLLCLVGIQVANADSSMTSEMVENAVQTIYIENREYEIEVLVISETADGGRGSVKFRVNGEVTEELRTGEKDLLADGSIIYVNRIWQDAGSAVAFTFYGPVEQADIPCEGKLTSLTQGNKFTHLVNFKELVIEAFYFDGNKARFKLNGEVTNLLSVGSKHRVTVDSSEITEITVTKIKDDDGKKVVTYCLTSNRPITQLSENRVCCQNSKGKFLSTMEECINNLQGTPRYEMSLSECTPGYGNPTMKIDLSNYPQLFFEGDTVNAVMVVGDNAPAEDVIAATDITVSFEKKQTKPAALASELKPNEERSLYRNIISVGRPCDNAVTAQILRSNGISDYDSDCSYGLKPGQAIVYLFDYNGFAHMLVFGYSKVETRQAARALSMQKMKGMKQLLNFNDGQMPQPGPHTVELYCEDSDGGIEPYKTGQVYIPDSDDIKKKEDTCYVPAELLENGLPNKGSTVESCTADELCYVTETYCSQPESLKKTVIGIKYVPCPNGCKYGACIKGNEEQEAEEAEEPAETEKEPPISETKDKECVGCKKNGACMQFGIRLVENKTPVYCDIDSALKPQMENDKACQNSYECLSNSCNDGVCQSISEKIEGIRQDLQEQKGILEKIFEFFKKIFG